MIADTKAKLMSRKEALALGLNIYFTGIPCIYGHIAERSALNGTCVECRRVNAQTHYRANPENSRARTLAWRKANPERNRLRTQIWRETNPDYMRIWPKANPNKHQANHRARKASKLRAIPIWANKEKIEAVYKEAIRLSAETGIEHHVDHAIPLKHPLVCGLHVELNLQVITKTTNLSKGNYYGC